MGISIKAKIIVFILIISLLVSIATGFFVEAKLLDDISPKFEMEPWVYFLILFFVIQIISAFFAFTIIRPIDEIIINTQLIAEGRYGQRLKVRSSDEFGRLSRAFNSMSMKLKRTNVQRSHFSDIAAQERSKTDLIIDSMTEGVIVTDEDYKIIMINTSAQKIFDLDESKLMNRHIIHLLQKFDLQNVTDKFPEIDRQEILPQRNINAIRVEAELEKPRKAILKFTIAKVLNERKFPVGTVTVIEDITRMKEIDRMKSDFISTISHELRTPLTSILGYTSLLLEGKMGDLEKKQKKSLEIVDKEAKRLAELIEDILDLSKLESGKTKLRIESLDLAALLKSLPIVELPKKKGLIFDVIAPPDLPKVECSRVKISQVFTNIISNAIKFTDKGGKITVRFRMLKEHVRVDIKDSGVGIEKENMPKLFNKFYQVQSHLTRSQSGTGLGLAIIKEIIGLHGGLIGVSSKIGHGTTVSFVLPVVRKEKKRDTNCWEYMKCGKVGCPAYNSEGVQCWLEPGTLCKKNSKEPCFDKIDTCIYCPVFRGDED